MHVPRDMTASLFVSKMAILGFACVIKDLCLPKYFNLHIMLCLMFPLLKSIVLGA